MATAYHDQLAAPTAPKSDALTPARDVDESLTNDARQMLRSLERAFGQSFSVVDCSTGQLLIIAEQGLPIDFYNWLPSCEQVARRGRPEILDEFSPLLLFAVPLVDSAMDASLVAVGTFVTERVEREAQVAAAALEFGVDVEQAYRWAECRHPGRRRP